MKITVSKKFILGRVENKGKVNLYTLIDMDDFSKVTAIGVKTEKEIAERSVVKVSISIRTKPERFELLDGQKKYVEVASIFVSSMEVSE